MEGRCKGICYCPLLFLHKAINKMKHTDEVIAHINQYTIYANVGYQSGEEPIILNVHIEPMPDVDDLTFSRDIVVKADMTMDSLIMKYLPNAKLCNQWLDEAIKQEA